MNQATFSPPRPAPDLRAHPKADRQPGGGVDETGFAQRVSALHIGIHEGINQILLPRGVPHEAVEQIMTLIYEAVADLGALALGIDAIR